MQIDVPRRDGGRGLTNIEASHEIAIKGLVQYLEMKLDTKYLVMVYTRNIKNTGDTPAGTTSSEEG